MVTGALLAQAFAQDDAPATLPQVPGDDIFGFTSPTDLGSPGETAISSENDGRVGKRDGRYWALDQKLEFSRSITERWWIAASVFAAHNHSRNVTGVPDIRNSTFDGVSFEIAYKLISRSASNPFAVTVSVEPRWGRIDGVLGLPSTNYGATFKLFTDAVVVPETLYWAANIEASTQNARDPILTDQIIPSSSLLVSTALTWQTSPAFFVGAEARYFTGYDNAGLHHPVSRALYIGPTFAWHITEKLILNATWQPQIYGRASTNPGQRLDLDNFERQQFRAKLVWTF